MSTHDLHENTLDANCTAPDCSAIQRVIPGRKKDLGGFSVTRVLPTRKTPMVGPWIFFDHMGPAEFAPGEGINVRPHPHINLATVTYTFEGEIWHQDSLGSNESIKPGDINLMLAGSGIVHSERTTPEIRKSGQRLHGLQLWLALPEKDEELPPAFYHYDASEIPQVSVDGTPVRVMIGEAYGVQSPVKMFARTLYLEARLKAGETLELPTAEELAVYTAIGELEIDGEVIEEFNMAVLNSSRPVTVKATKDSFIGVVGGEKMPPRHIYWNFVSSSKERIEKAKQMWRDQEFEKVPGDSEEYIPLP